MADAIVSLFAIVLVVMLGGAALAWALRRRPEHEEKARKVLEQRNALAGLVTGLYRMASDRKDAEPLAAVMADEIEKVIGTADPWRYLAQLRGEGVRKEL